MEETRLDELINAHTDLKNEIAELQANLKGKKAARDLLQCKICKLRTELTKTERS